MSLIRRALFLGCWLLVLLADAQVHLSINDAKNVDTTRLTAPRGEMRADPGSIILCIVMILVGLGYCFYGFKLFLPTMFVTGFIVFANVSLYILNLIKPMSTLEPNNRNTYLYVMLGVGVVGGALLVCFFNFGVWLIGIVFGLALFSLTTSVLFLSSMIALAVMLVVCLIAGVVLIRFFERIIVISATALAGALVAVAGVDVVLNNGFIYDQLTRLNGGTVEFSGASLIQLLAALAVAAIGFLYQFNVHKGVFGAGRRGNKK
jgi:hypothetical protein